MGYIVANMWLICTDQNNPKVAPKFSERYTASVQRKWTLIKFNFVDVALVADELNELIRDEYFDHASTPWMKDDVEDVEGVDPADQEYNGPWSSSHWQDTGGGLHEANYQPMLVTDTSQNVMHPWRFKNSDDTAVVQMYVDCNFLVIP